jgi:myo-inositol-1(or 4)-monophosphatase
VGRVEESLPGAADVKALLRGGNLWTASSPSDHAAARNVKSDFGMKQTILDCVRPAGEILLRYLGKDSNARCKGDHSNVVTDADLESERWIVGQIRARFPRHSIIAEETGYARQGSEFTWVIDPLDGTSNFAAGLPWFGVLVAVLQNASPIMAAMYLPVTDTLYFSEKGQGVWRDGTRVQVTPETDPLNVLCAYGLDASADEEQSRGQAGLLHHVANGVRNIRASNCLLDFCYTIDGRFGGCVNLNTRIWDIAPLALMLPEAGGVLTELSGAGIVFRLGEEPFDRNYTVLGASRALHPKLLALVRRHG